MKKNNENKGLEKAIEIYGDLSKLARGLNVNRDRLKRIKEGKQPMSIEIAKKIMDITNGAIDAEELLGIDIEVKHLPRKVKSLKKVRDILVSRAKYIKKWDIPTREKIVDGFKNLIAIIDEAIQFTPNNEEEEEEDKDV